jgi:hypothetical protein
VLLPCQAGAKKKQADNKGEKQFHGKIALLESHASILTFPAAGGLVLASNADIRLLYFQYQHC